MLYVSSPVLKQGPFYDAFTVNSATFITLVVGLTDCPRIAKEKITDIPSLDHRHSFRANFLPIELRQNREPGVETNQGEL